MELTQIWRYPVKSCSGFSLSAARLDEYGLEGDRLFAIAREDGGLVTQKTVARLNLVVVLVCDAQLQLRAPGLPDLIIDSVPTGPVTAVQLYDGPAPGLCMGPRAAEWLSDFLGKPCRLVRSHARFERRMPAVAQHLFLKEQERYPDCAPILLIGQASLDDLNVRLDPPVEMSRFRPNFVIAGAAPYAEDNWRRIRIGDLVFDYMGPCERCGMTAIAPGTDRRGREPLLTLRTYRYIQNGLESGIIFGAYFQPRQLGEVSIGAPVTVLSVGEPLPVLG